MSLSSLNTTQNEELMAVLFKSTASSDAPLLLVESFILGVLCACVALASYLLWVKAHSFPRAPFFSTLWIVLTAMVIHWAFSLRQLELTLAGRSLEISMYEINIDDALNWGTAWRAFLPIVTETVLFGFASFLFALTVYTSFWPMCLRWRSCPVLVVPVMASLMYTLSVAHWAISLRLFTALRTYSEAMDGLATYPSETVIATAHVALVAILALNVVMSDSVVLWRMCVVWENARTAIAFGAVLLATTLGLNIANLTASAREELLEYLSGSSGTQKNDSVELIATYGTQYVGLAAVFVSLAGNLCATILVGVKAWLHRSRVSKQLLSAGNRRTFAQRVMELLVESGVVYTAIWLLYCISFFRVVTQHYLFGSQFPYTSVLRVTAAEHLDAAMAQITTIYPLMVFILVALDKIHHSRGPLTLRNVESPNERDYAVTVTFDVDVERSIPSALPAVTLPRTSDSELAMGETKQGPGEV